ncbi:ABC transporter ATP-binding protein [Mariprofundus ferrooxydans]|uniref:ABC transporter n=1 Tax=Mariprofundus ferrooxydans PV-1 TaxID=314345 RepID=Q0EZ89_9PROT|nr:ABC transporter [Mariprofundus ferrooxydans PV-1]
MIKVEGVSKKYQLGHIVSSKNLTNPFKRGLQRLTGRSMQEEVAEEFWALRNVSFDIQQGEVVGIIGKNGAGKSTLLKILSRITDPSTGRIELNGRVSSLLEVGTGFNPELTGRENIYLNGAILGMSRKEIQSKFDEIVAFAEVEKFLDTPVKRYSSGMYVRLAFAVAAHLEPEILIVDEVLAVGDATFQKKCMGKMQEVGKQGRTVLFVSHNMGTISRLCNRAILLNQGGVVADGPVHHVIKSYLQEGTGTGAWARWDDSATAPGDDVARLLSVRVCSEDGITSERVDIHKPVGIEVEYEVLKSGHVLQPNCHFFNSEGVYAFISIDNKSEHCDLPKELGRYKSTAWIPGNLLAEGTMLVGVALTTFEPQCVHFYEQDVVAFEVVDNASGDSARGDYHGDLPGVVRPQLVWETSVSQGKRP